MALKTKDEITDETGFDFSQGGTRRQIINGKKYRIVGAVLFYSSKIVGEWEIYAKVLELHPEWER